MGVLVDPNRLDTESQRSDVQAAAQTTGQQLIILDVNSDRDIETAFATFVQRGAGALFVGAGAFFNSHRERIVALVRLAMRCRRAMPGARPPWPVA